MKKNIIFEIATEKDCENLAKLKREVWETTYRGIYPSEKFDNYDLKEQTEKFKKYVSDENGVFFVAKDKTKNKLVAYCYVGFSSRAFVSGVPEIILLYVLKSYQCFGIGRTLFEKGKNFLKEKGFDKFLISCNKYNLPAQKFYERMGGKVLHIDEDDEDKSKPQIKFVYGI